jgi:hypothetical protein
MNIEEIIKELTAAREGLDASLRDCRAAAAAEAKEKARKIPRVKFLARLAGRRFAASCTNEEAGRRYECALLVATCAGRLPPPAVALESYLMRQRAWSQRTFGPGRRTAGIAKHIRLELEEIAADPKDWREWIDLVILALDGAWRAGGSPAEIATELWRKQEVNFCRTWPAPVSEDEPVEHVRWAGGIAP